MCRLFFNQINFLLAKVALILFGKKSSRLIASQQKFWKAANISIDRQKSFEKAQSFTFFAKVAKMSRLFFNHLDLPLAKVVLILFGKKSSRLIASKSLNQLQSLRLFASESLQNVSFFFSIISIYRQQKSFWYFLQKNHLDLSLAKVWKNCNHLN